MQAVFCQYSFWIILVAFPNMPRLLSISTNFLCSFLSNVLQYIWNISMHPFTALSDTILCVNIVFFIKVSLWNPYSCPTLLQSHFIITRMICFVLWRIRLIFRYNSHSFICGFLDSSIKIELLRYSWYRQCCIFFFKFMFLINFVMKNNLGLFKVYSEVPQSELKKITRIYYPWVES